MVPPSLPLSLSLSPSPSPHLSLALSISLWVVRDRSVTMLVEISDFLNCYVFKALWHLAEPGNRPLVVVDGTGSAKVGLNDSLAVRYATRLLSVIYDCDCRRVFTEEGHWLTTAITTKRFEAELDREREARLKESATATPTAHERAHQVLMKIPHVLPHLFRVRLLRDEIQREKSAIAAGRDRYADTPHITIRRAYLLTDGVREVPRLPVDSLKDTFRIKFINRQGLDEAGIDENGVFKEYVAAMSGCYGWLLWVVATMGVMLQGVRGCTRMRSAVAVPAGMGAATTGIAALSPAFVGYNHLPAQSDQ